MKFLCAFALSLVALLPIYSFAAIDYISLHEIESNTADGLLVKLNIVEKEPTSRLKFVLQQPNTNTVLPYQRLNNFMLRLKGPNAVTSDAAIVVYQAIDNRWQQVKTITLMGTPKRSAKSFASGTVKIQPHKKPRPITSLEPAPAASSQQACLLIRKPKETLWSLASRYSTQWNIDVYSAMIAIYTQNKQHFGKEHIKLLKDNVDLACPEQSITSALNSKAVSKAKFNGLHNLPLTK